MNHFLFPQKFPRPALSVPPLFYLPVVFAAGMWASSFFRFPFGPVAYFALCGLSAAAGVAGKRRFILFALALFFLLGILFETNSRTFSKDDFVRLLPDGFLALEGTVETVPDITRHGRKETVSFVLNVHSFKQKGPIRRSSGHVQVFLYNPGRPIQFGARVLLRGRIAAPAGKKNPYTLDYRAYLAQQGIVKVFRGVGASSVKVLPGSGANSFLIVLNRFRVHLKDRLNQLLPYPSSALGEALILGFRKNIPRNISDDFARTGTAHLLSISGLHIALIGKLIFMLGRCFRIPRGWNLILTAFLISVYTVLAGGGAPVLRSAVMGSAILIGLLIGTDRNLKSAFFFSFLLLLVWDPRFLFQPSFQLSFLAMASLIFLRPKLETSSLSLGHHGARLWSESLSVLIGMFPAILWYFHLFSPVSILANTVAIPASMFGIVCEFVLFFVDFIFRPLGPFCAYPAHFFFAFTVWFIHLCAKIPFGHFYLRTPPAVFFFLYYGFLLIWIFFSHRFRFLTSKAVPVILCAVCILFFGLRFHSSFHVLFFDLGTAEASFVSFSNGRNCLINTGRKYPDDQAYWSLRPYLMASGLWKLDCVFLTASDRLHTGGLETITRYFHVSDFFIPSKNINRKQFSFGPAGGIEILAALNGKPVAFRVREEGVNVLYLASDRTNIFETLLMKPEIKSDVVFLSHQEYGVPPEEEIFLKYVQPRLIVSNQQENLLQFKSQLQSIVPAEVLFLKNLGAIELRYFKGSWNWKNFAENSLS